MKTKTLFRTIVLVLILVLSLGKMQSPTQAALLPPAAPQAGDHPWNLLYLDGLQDQINIGLDASMAFDLISNLPYISYYNAQTHNLVLASPANGSNCGGGKWWCRDVDALGDVGQGSSIAIHGQVSTVDGKLGISYYDATNKRLRLAQWACSSPNVCAWTFYNFFSGNAVITPGRYSSLQYDSGGRPHIAYFMSWDQIGNPTSYIKYCKWVGVGGNDAGGAFTCTDVDYQNGLTYGLYPSLALDASGDPWIAYYNGQSGDLDIAMFGANGGGDCYSTDWYCDWIDSPGDVGKFPSLKIVAVGSEQKIHVAYYDATHGKLKHAFFSLTGANCGTLVGGIQVWKCNTVATMGVGVNWPSISMMLDEAGHPLIAYQDYNDETNNLMLARIPSTLGLLIGNCGEIPGLIGPYQCDVLDTGGHGGVETSDGFYPAIGRSATGLVYVVYQEYNSFYNQGTLKLAYQNFGAYLPLVYK